MITLIKDWSGKLHLEEARSWGRSRTACRQRLMPFGEKPDWQGEPAYLKSLCRQCRPVVLRRVALLRRAL